MNILFSVHLYPPTHNCGGEYYIHNFSKFMISHGHQVRVILHQARNHGIDTHYIYEGVYVSPPIQGVVQACMEWSDAVISHLEYAPWTIQMCNIFRKPFFFISHNSHDYACIRSANWPLNVIYNSEWMRNYLQYKQNSMVLHPPISDDKIIPDNESIDKEFITLINCNERKGGSLFAEIARQMPERKFLCVRGSYDEQVVPYLPNITSHDNTPDIKPIYARTRILLMPSAYESWGSTATEAMANGIPVIAFATPGLKENLANAGILINSRNYERWAIEHEKPCFGYFDEKTKEQVNFLDNTDVAMWIKQIKRLDDRKLYLSISEKARQRAKELDPAVELAEAETFIYNACINYRHPAS